MTQHPEMLLYLVLALLLVLAILAKFKASHKQEDGWHAASACIDGHKLVNNGGALKIEEGRIVFANHGINIDNSNMTIETSDISHIGVKSKTPWAEDVTIFMKDGSEQKFLTYKKDRIPNRLQEQLSVKGR